MNLLFILAQKSLEKDLQHGKNRIKELWKKNCEQVKEFNLIICEKDKELESLKKELKAKNMIVELLTQPVAEQLNRVCDTKVEGTTLGEPVATMPHPDQNITQSQIPIKLTGQPLSQSHTDLRDYVCAAKKDTHQCRGTPPGICTAKWGFHWFRGTTQGICSDKGKCYHFSGTSDNTVPSPACKTAQSTPDLNDAVPSPACKTTQSTSNVNSIIPSTVCEAIQPTSDNVLIPTFRAN